MMVNIAVEGESDREAAKSVVIAAGRTVDRVAVAGGKTRLDPKIPKYNAAAKRQSWVVFRDSDGTCPVQLREQLLSTLTSAQSKRFSLRIAHNMTEAWLMADNTGFAEFFHVRIGKIPVDVENLPHAKRTLLDLCRKSPRAIRDGVVTSDGLTGPEYVSRINRFAKDHWDVSAAATRSGSLQRAIAAIRLLPED
ncbi:hypothetical protein GII30_08330 [Gordonia amarae]|nr:hypothetical protein GII35_08555 [Gordonia amarae]QHN21548.1 hypothetical protein GII34_08335 [Gordonia amarae]QHN30398.1 hypothetical protein GII32_08345 [Gordonia amarae]QHN39175.1 hypothetical protein GII30_08330 [Gordonia amarae]